MDKPDTATCVIEHSVTTAQVPINQHKIHVMDNLDEQTILIQETVEEISCPAQIQVSGEVSEKDIEASSMVIFPFTGGGRGPVINYGETITLHLLLSLLNDTLNEAQLNPALRTRLNSFTDSITSHNDSIAAVEQISSDNTQNVLATRTNLTNHINSYNLVNERFDSNILEIQDTMSTHTTEITNISTTVINHSLQVSTIEGSLQGCLDNCNALSLASHQHTLDIDRLTNELSTHSNNYDSLFGTVSGNSLSINTLKTDYVNYARNFDTMSALVGDNSSHISDLQLALSSHYSDYELLRIDTLNNSQAVNSIELRLTDCTDNYTTLNSTVNELSTEMSTVGSAIGSLDLHVDGLSTAVFGYSAAIGSLQNSQAATEEAVSYIDSITYNNSEDISSLVSSFGVHIDHYDNLDNRVSFQGESIDSHTNSIDSINAAIDRERIKAIANRHSLYQSGFASHNDVVALSSVWQERPPVIDISYSHGVLLETKKTSVGLDTDCITYIEVPDREILYGHSGLVNNNFIVKAAILEPSIPTETLINWAPSDLVGSSALGHVHTSPQSTIATTSSECMGLRIKGTLGLLSHTSSEVSGVMQAQMSIDDGPWTTIAYFSRWFAEDDSLPIEQDFDVLFAFNQTHHTYEFRGMLIIDPYFNETRALTGSINISTLTESGTGVIISNDLQLKWSARE